MAIKHLKGKRITASRAIAEVIGCDMADMPGYRYQSTRTSQPIYTIGSFYYAAHTLPKDEMGAPWRHIGAFRGVEVFRSEMIRAKNG